MSRSIFYKMARARMPTGELRRVRVRAIKRGGALFPDTPFTAPAYLTTRGQVVRGYVECADGLALSQDLEPCTELRFTPSQLQARLLPKPD